VSLFDITTEHCATFRLPYPPSINNYYGYKPRGGRYIKAEGREFRSVVIHSLKQAFAEREWTPLECRLSVWVEVFCPDRRRRDLDNIKKALLDALTHAGVYQDDCLIDDLRSVRGPVVKGGLVRVHVRKILSDPKTAAELFTENTQ